ncbi:MAG: type IX secretion system outer membrane channel protein PorV [Bacteroidaceae bacterium]|nr:type IX secretion system outer membrane channel protein PorV [Bacteroidaceae bacterium]MBR1801424.1 type IX secretion system outer membrane channel protein PorV [Bacteroidaceae bacterium]
MTTLRNILTFLLLLLALRVSAQDQQNMFNPVQYSVPMLAIAPDARGGGMGDVGVATEADVNSQYWNPAKYPFCVARAGVGLSYTPWLRKIVSDINLANVSGFYRIGDYSAISGSLRYFSLGDVELWDNFSESLSSGATANMTIKPYELAFDAAYSRMLSEYFSMAVGLRFIFSDITFDYTEESSPGKAFAADIAMYYNNYINIGRRECGLAVGLNISNIGSKINYGGTENPEFIPTNLRLGLNLTIPFDEYNRFSIAAEANKLLVPTYPMQGAEESGEEFRTRVQKEYYDVSPIAGIFKSFHDAPNGFKEELQEIQWSLGAEYSYNDRFFIRAGYHHEHANKGNRKYITAGAGFKMSIFSIDAAYVFSTAQTNPLDQTMRFTLGFDLDGIRDLFGKKR